MTESAGNKPDYTELHRYLRQLVDPAQQRLQRRPEFAKVEAYWHIGRIIVETEQQGQERADYGIHLIEELAQILTKNYGKGYKTTNLWTFRQFYLTYQIPHTVCGELRNLKKVIREELMWSHYRLLIQLKDPLERKYYLQKAANERWSVRTLQKLIQSGYYQQVEQGGDQLVANQRIVAGGVFVFNNQDKESNLRSRIASIKKTLLTRYVGFAFTGQHQYISVHRQDTWIELIFYHIVLRRYILINTGEHNPEAISLMKDLVHAYTRKEAPGTDNPSVGLLIDNRGLVRMVTGHTKDTVSMDVSAVLPLKFN